METLPTLWTTSASLLRQQVSESVWMSCFEGLAVQSLEDDLLVLGAPNFFVRDRLDSRWRAAIEEALREAAGRTIKVDIVIDTAPRSTSQQPDSDANTSAPIWSSNNDPERQADAVVPARNNASTTTSGSTSSSQGSTGAGSASSSNATLSGSAVDHIDPRYTFDAFVIGASNRFAHAAAQSVAENPAKAYNPLFIHGGSGLGKTHLLHAIGNYVREQFPSRRVQYVSTETFVSEFIDAVRHTATTDFKRRYRDCDVLLIDDIQLLEGKEATQEEFFHTFNSLYGAQKQIVITSDRPPKSIATLEDRMRSRFMSGLITDVQPPELETRLAILRKKAETERVSVPDDVLEIIAAGVKDNIRELEGALIRVAAYASLSRMPITVELAERVLTDLLADQSIRKITPQSILEATATMYGFSIEELCGTSRRRPLVNARQTGMYVFRDLTDLSYPAIAREFGGRDHTTVIHAVEKITALMKEERKVYDQVTELITTIKAGS